MHESVASKSQVEIAAGRIIVRPSFANLLVCGRIGGGDWDSALGAWTFPATKKYVRLVQKHFQTISVTDQPDSVLQPIDVNAEDGDACGASDSPAVTPPEPMAANGEGPEAPAAPPESEATLPSGLATRP